MTPPKTDQQPLISIEYNQTKVVNVGSDVFRQRRVIMGLKGDRHVDLFRQLRTKVLRRLRENQWSSLAVTSPTPGAGKSFLTINLAIALALEVNQTVLVVDADLRNPSVAWYLGLDVENGLLDYLTRDIPLTPLLINPGFQRLVILPGKGYTNHSSELLAAHKMSRLVAELKSKYSKRIILFDMPPLLASDDTLLFMPNFDAALLVVEDGENTKEQVQKCMNILEGTELMGIALNKAREAVSDSYYYMYGYGYGNANRPPAPPTDADSPAA